MRYAWIVKKQVKRVELNPNDYVPSPNEEKPSYDTMVGTELMAAEHDPDAYFGNELETETTIYHVPGGGDGEAE